MTSVAPPIRLTPRMVVAAWGGITRRELWTTFLLGCLLVLYYIAVGLLPPDRRFRFYLIEFIQIEFQAFALLLAVVVADRATGKDPARRGAYVLAILVGAAAGDAVVWVTALAALSYVGLPEKYAYFPSIGLVLYAYLELVVLGVATVWIVNDRRRAARARGRMHRAELDRTEAAKRTIESELQAMQARVEPQFLFNTLAQVRDLYRTSAARGERMLDDLIAYLRAAMPHMRDTSSTVAQEIDLARAYLDIVKIRLGNRLAFDIDVPAGIGTARMPPMMLLPLIDHAIVHGLERSTATGTIRIESGVSDGRLRLTIADSGAGFVPDTWGDGITSIRERLTALYGQNARLDLRRLDDRTTQAVMQIPYEPTSDEAPS